MSFDARGNVCSSRSRLTEVILSMCPTTLSGSDQATERTAETKDSR